MVDDVCEIPKCRAETHLCLHGVWICKKHWDMYCDGNKKIVGYIKK